MQGKCRFRVDLRVASQRFGTGNGALKWRHQEADESSQVEGFHSQWKPFNAETKNHI